jgi:hypothetical protein
VVAFAYRRRRNIPELVDDRRGARKLVDTAPRRL